jgi:hypothetical protein
MYVSVMEWNFTGRLTESRHTEMYFLYIHLMRQFKMICLLNKLSYEHNNTYETVSFLRNSYSLSYSLNYLPFMELYGGNSFKAGHGGRAV